MGSLDLYRSPAAQAERIVEFLGDQMRTPCTALAILRPQTSGRIIPTLVARGIDPRAIHLVSVAAMMEVLFDADGFRQREFDRIMGGYLEGRDAPTCFVGELEDALIKQGRMSDAVAMERAAHRLLDAYDVRYLCSYDASRDAPEIPDEILRLHGSPEPT